MDCDCCELCVEPCPGDCRNSFSEWSSANSREESAIELSLGLSERKSLIEADIFLVFRCITPHANPRYDCSRAEYVVQVIPYSTDGWGSRYKAPFCAGCYVRTVPTALRIRLTYLDDENGVTEVEEARSKAIEYVRHHITVEKGGPGPDYEHVIDTESLAWTECRVGSWGKESKGWCTIKSKEAQQGFTRNAEDGSDVPHAWECSWKTSSTK